MEDLMEDPTSVGPPYQGYSHPISMNSDGGTTTHQPDTSLSPQSSHHPDWTGADIHKSKAVYHIYQRC